jgi:hypothetical protein
MTQDGLPAPGASVSADQLEKKIRETEEKLRSLPMGWHCGSASDYTAVWKCVSAQLGWLSVVGWCVTAAALTLGAPFWFDTLSKVVNLRGAGPKPAKQT